MSLPCPIVRINPREIHINNPDFYDSIYASSSHIRNKDPGHIIFGSAPLALVSTISHSQHRLRRSILSPFFSKASIMRVESLIQAKADRLIARLNEVGEKGRTVDLYIAFTAFASDTVSEYAYGVGYTNLEEKDFNGYMHETITRLMHTVHVARFFPFLFPILSSLPVGLARRLSPGLGKILEYRAFMSRSVARALRERGVQGKERTTLFEALASPSVPEQERTAARIQDEAWVVNLAASETVARALTMLVFFVVKNEHVLQTLRKELKPVMQVSECESIWKQLEALPYLVSCRRVLYEHTCRYSDVMNEQTAVIHESLRLSFGPATRLPRISPDKQVMYKDWVIPPGVSQATLSPVSTSLSLSPSTLPF